MKLLDKQPKKVRRNTEIPKTKEEKGIQTKRNEAKSENTLTKNK